MSRLLSAVTGMVRVIGETYRLGFRALRVAPVIVAIAVVPEFIQHVVEIRLGMFDSLSQFRALADNPDRWLFGYAKVAGLLIAMLAIARFWAVGSVRKTFLIALPDLLRLIFAILLTFAVAYPFDWLATRDLPLAVTTAVRIVSALVQAGLTLFLIAALVGDRSLTLKAAFTERWPSALVLVIALIAAAGPGQLLHMLDHRLALGQPAAIVWALMLWDSLVVGLIAALTGSALWAAYRSGATWHGWVPAFVPAITADLSPDASGTVSAGVPPKAQPPVSVDEPSAQVSRRRRSRPGPRPRG